MESTEISFPLFGEGFIINPPSYITIFGFNLYIYGLIITLGFVLAGLYIYKRRNTFDLTQDNVLDLIILAVPCGIVGARLFYAIFNISDYVGPGNWLNIFKVREGGLAVYGGVIGGAIGIYIYSRIKKMPVSKLLDAAVFGLFIGQAVGRWGNFFNREAFGETTEVPWKMGLRRYSSFIYVHPTFLYESLWNVIGFVLLHIFSKKIREKYHGQYFLFYIAWYGFGRYMIEGLRTDSLYISGTNIRISQLLAALSFSVAVVLLLRNRLLGTRSLDKPMKLALADGPEEDEVENPEIEIQNSEFAGEEEKNDSVANDMKHTDSGGIEETDRADSTDSGAESTDSGEE